jgi:hypothetical protein
MNVAPIMIISIRTPMGGSEVAHTGIGWFEELVAQIQKRLVVGGLGTEALVYGIRG